LLEVQHIIPGITYLARRISCRRPFEIEILALSGAFTAILARKYIGGAEDNRKSTTIARFIPMMMRSHRRIVHRE